MILRTILASIIIMLLSIPVTAQDTYPGADLFSYECRPDGITFYYLDTDTIRITFDQLNRILHIAIDQQKNQLIAATNRLGVWALKSNEIQLHINDNPDETMLVLPADVCPRPSPTTPAPSSSSNARAIAFAQSNGQGSAFAYAEVLPFGRALAYAQSSGNGSAFAFAQTSGGSNYSHIHTVQPGETLFRIALRYQVPVNVIASANGIQNPNVIFAGQQLVIP